MLELACKATYEVDPRLTLKEALGGFVQIGTKSGTLSRRVDVPLGHPENPVSQEALVAKFKHCAQHAARGISERRLDEVMELIWNLEEVDNMNEIRERL